MAQTFPPPVRRITIGDAISLANTLYIKNSISVRVINDGNIVYYKQGSVQ